MAGRVIDPDSISTETRLKASEQSSDDPGDNLFSLHSATAVTDYSAFVGREEPYLSSSDGSSPKPKRVSKSRAKKSRKARHTLDSSSKLANQALRPAQDVLSRLRHDPQLSSQSFTIGYLDRHSPEVMELPLSDWRGGDVTDEDFIPLHRILYFKRNEDGKKVWDRKARLDSIFGSGLGSVKGESVETAFHQSTDMNMSAQESSENAGVCHEDRENQRAPWKSLHGTHLAAKIL